MEMHEISKAIYWLHPSLSKFVQPVPFCLQKEMHTLEYASMQRHGGCLLFQFAHSRRPTGTAVFFFLFASRVRDFLGSLNACGGNLWSGQSACFFHLKVVYFAEVKCRVATLRSRFLDFSLN